MFVDIILRVIENPVWRCHGGFTAGRHHMTVAKRVFRSGPWRPLSVSRVIMVDRKSQKKR